jgi:hypothetical protein
MRVTNSIITRNSQTRLQVNLQGIDRLRTDISSGVRLRKMSDDPTSGGELVRIGSSMRALTQFKRNVDNVPRPNRPSSTSGRPRPRAPPSSASRRRAPPRTRGCV